MAGDCVAVRPNGMVAFANHHSVLVHALGDGAGCGPKPIADKRLPVHISGHTRAAARRAGAGAHGLPPVS